MQQEHSTLTSNALRQSLVALLAGLLYLFSLASAIWMPAVAGVANSIALLVLGAAVYQVSLARIAPSSQRLSVRSQSLWRRQRWLAYAGVAVVYLALTYGTLASLMGGVWSCTTLPLCAPFGNEAMTTLIHRVIAAGGALLIVTLAVWAVRTHHEAIFRPAALWTSLLMAAQTIAGVLLVLAAREGEGVSLITARLAHFALGAFTWSAL